jgi:hypothetical protein
VVGGSFRIPVAIVGAVPCNERAQVRRITGLVQAFDTEVDEMARANVRDFSNPETIEAWRCIGCGRIEVPANCVGVCEDRKVELVGAWDYAEVAVALEEAAERIVALESLLGRLARITPREGGWKDSYLAIQAQARKMLALPNTGNAYPRASSVT